MKRPIGVTVMAVLAIAVGVQWFALGLSIISDFPWMRPLLFTHPETRMEALWVGLLFLATLICAVVGIGLWRLRQWARWLVIVLLALPFGEIAVISILGYFLPDFYNVDFWRRHPWLLVLPVGVCGLCLGYMFIDHVRKAFSA
jgi:hypothetical protein